MYSMCLEGASNRSGLWNKCKFSGEDSIEGNGAESWRGAAVEDHLTSEIRSRLRKDAGIKIR